MLVLKEILPDDLDKHFSLLHVGIRILNSDKFFLKYVDYAEVYLQRFVLMAQYLYGYESQTMVVHLLSHLADDVRYFKRPLYEMTAYLFENLSGKLKKIKIWK